MANVHFRLLQTPLCSEWHLSTIKATLHQINKVLEDSDERQSVLTSLYQAKDFQIVLGIVKEWYLESLRALLVNGRWATEDTKHQLIRSGSVDRAVLMHATECGLKHCCAAWMAGRPG